MDSEYILNNDLPYLMYRLREAGLTVELDFDQTRRRMLLLLNGSVKWSIHDLTLKLSGAEPAAHQAMMEPWIPYLMELTRLGQTVLRNPEELRRRVHTEFVVGACLIVCVSVFCLKGLMHDE